MKMKMVQEKWDKILQLLLGQSVRFRQTNYDNLRFTIHVVCVKVGYKTLPLNVSVCVSVKKLPYYVLIYIIGACEEKQVYYISSTEKILGNPYFETLYSDRHMQGHD